MVWKSIQVVHHINILIKFSKYIVTKDNYSISTLEFQKLDDISITLMDYSSNEMTRADHSNKITINTKPNLPLQRNTNF